MIGLGKIRYIFAIVSGTEKWVERPIGGEMPSRRYPETVPMLIASAVAVGGFILYVVLDGLWR